MPTQYIEDPETKERIPFEWDKPEPPNSAEIQALFDAVRTKKTTVPWMEKGATTGGLRRIGEFALAQIPGLTYLRPEERKEFREAPSGLPWEIERGRKEYEAKLPGLPIRPTVEDILSRGEALQEYEKTRPETKIERVGEEVGKAGELLLGGQIAEATGRALGTIPRILPISFKRRAKEVFESVKGPYKIEKGAIRRGIRGAERKVEELKIVEKELYSTAQKGTNLTKKVNFANTRDELNRLEQNEAFKWLDPEDKARVRNAVDKVMEDISPGQKRVGKARITQEQMEDIFETGTGEFIEGIEQVRIPGTFAQGRATRSMLSRKSAEAFKKGQNDLGKMYNELKSYIDTDLEQAIGSTNYALWKGADAFKTRRHILGEIFGKSEIYPGRYKFWKVREVLKSIPAERLQTNFTQAEIKALESIKNAGNIRIVAETFPILKVVIPAAVLKAAGVPIPGLRELRTAAHLTHILPGVGIGGY